MFEAPRYTTVGMTDESCACVFGYVTGELSAKYLEDSEEIIQVLADRDEVRRILKEENVAASCAYHERGKCRGFMCISYNSFHAGRRSV